MTKPFNLAEVKIAERNRCRREVNRRLRVAAGLIVLTLIVAMASFACKVSITAKASRLTLELADIQQRCLKVKEEMADAKLLTGQRHWQMELTEGSRRWLNILDEVLKQLPPDSWINRIENSPQNTSVSLEGGAASYESVAALISRLRASPNAADVQLSSSRVTMVDDETFVDFALSIKLKALVATTASLSPPQSSAESASQAQGPS